MNFYIGYLGLIQAFKLMCTLTSCFARALENENLNTTEHTLLNPLSYPVPISVVQRRELDG